MNITTFNDVFEAPVLSKYSRKLWDQWKNAPLFEYEMEVSKCIDDERERRGESLYPLPYPIFRGYFDVSYRVGYTKESNVQFDLFIREDNEIWEIFFYPRNLSKEIKKARDGRYLTIGYLAARQKGPEIEVASKRYDPVKKEWKDNLSEEEQNESRKSVAYQVYCIVRTFAVDAMSDIVHTAQVVPNRPGKSVEWIKARTHYTLIHHGHPANTKNLSEGSHVAVDRKEQLTRMAHNRRAHYKTLKHERFRYARGKRIFVKASWVGPKEWKDEGGHQIYRILEEVNSKG